MTHALARRAGRWGLKHSYDLFALAAGIAEKSVLAWARVALYGFSTNFIYPLHIQPICAYNRTAATEAPQRCACGSIIFWGGVPTSYELLIPAVLRQ